MFHFRSVYGLLCLLVLTAGDKFIREELGVSGRLRFTSGQYGYYNCSIVDKRLLSNMKIGIFIHDHTTYIHYEINDTDSFLLRVNKEENFYFADIYIKKDVASVNPYVELSATNKNNGAFLGTTVLRLMSSHFFSSLPALLNTTADTVINILDDVFLGSVVGKLSHQTPHKQVIFYLEKSELKSMHAFAVSPDGRLIVTRRLNAKKRNRYKFKVNVGYLHSSVHSSINVHVNVLQGIRHLIDGSLKKSRLHVSLKGADTMPEFLHHVYNFSISELAVSNTIIGRLTKGSENVTFSISRGNAHKVFAIDKDNSVLYVNKVGKLDYEVKNIYKLHVKVKHNNLLSLATKLLIYIYITDENDNSPEFTREKYYVEMKEDLPVNSTILQLKAIDKDSNTNAEISYLLANDNKVPFCLSSNGSVIVASNINLKNMPSRYYLYVRAIDAGYPLRRETEVLVIVDIIGLNLHPPILEYLNCHVTISKTELTSPLMTIKAIDEDVNSRIMYYFLDPVPGLFLNATSGVLMVDRSSNNTMLKANVFASDGLYNTGNLTIDLKFEYQRKNINCRDNLKYLELMRRMENRKKIAVSPDRAISAMKHFPKLIFFAYPGDILHIDEDAQLDTPLGVFKASTSILQCPTYILYCIASGNVGHKFQIDLLNGTLYVYDKLNGLAVSAYKLEIKAYDMFGNSVSKFVHIKVDNINDTIPVFTNNGFYECNKTELRLGLCKVTAVVNGNQSSTMRMTYTILNGIRMFRIALKTGVLSMRKSIHDFTEKYIRVEASYGTKDVAHAVVHIVETGGNNNPPVCLSHQQRIKIATNTPAGAIVGRIFGYDMDDGKAGKITYTVVNKTTKFDTYFSLHPRTGLFRLKKGLTVKDKGYRFSVVVKLKDGGRPMLMTTCKVFKIIVDALGIYKPVFDHKETPLILHISSNIAEKAVAAQLNAAVSSQNKVNYQIVDGSGIGLFFIDKDVGKIRVANTNFKKSFYWLTVQAYVKANPLEYTNAHILIKIRHVTLKAPYFNPSVYHVALARGETRGNGIVQLFASDGYQGFSSNNILFSIHSGDDNNFFRIKRDGWLYAQNSPPVGTYALNVSVANLQNTSLISYGQVIVSVTDQAIKPIIFVGNEQGQIKLYETRGSRRPPYLFQCLATNHDRNFGSRISYKINSEAYFRIDPKTAVVESKRELRAGTTMFLLVKAAADGMKSATRFYYIQIIRRPLRKTKLMFKQEKYSITLNENSAKIKDFGNEVITDSASKLILFYVITGNDDLMFTFPPGSSLLVPVKELDYERRSFYTVEILAFDGSSLANTKVEINLINIDDNPLSASQPCFEAMVLENRKSVAPLITVQVTDLDHRGGGYFYEMMGSVQNKDFSVLNNGAITMEGTFDREVQSEHVVTVLAGITRKALTTFCVIVVVEDVNDNKPNFTKSSYEIKVLDSVAVGSRIMAVYATDEDSGANALLKYSFPIESQYFGIESRTGVIYVKKNLAPLSTKYLVLDIHVQDGGFPSFHSNAKVKITVLPDWNSVTFERSLYTSSIKENVKSGSLVATNIKVNNTLVNYEIAKQEDDCYSLFWMDPFTGIMLTTAVIDAEEHRNCSFVVNGIMHGEVVTSANVFVKIEDENDNKPIFGKSKYEGSVLESQKSFTVLLDSNGQPLRINADDFDDNLNGKVKYSFIENSASMYFMINENTGEILTNRVLDYEKHPKRFEFHVKATDQGFLALSNVVPVSITLVNVNDKKPEFLESYLATLFLPVYNGTFVEKVIALDDISDGSQLTYHLDDPYGFFGIDKFTGEIVVRNPSLLTNSSVLTIYVTATDGLYDAQTVVRIKLSSYKADQQFKFPYSIYLASVEENDRSVGIVKVINPVGYAIGERLFFTILNPTPLFHIGNVSGVVKMKEGAFFDRELVSYYLVHVEVHKICDVDVIARTTINVSVIDLNDNAPDFSVRKYFRAFDFDTNVGTSMLTVAATDADEGENANIIYSIKSQSDEEYFTCDKYSGEIILKKRFIKRHTRLRQLLIIQAADNGKPVLTSETKVEIVVLSKDQPMFTKTYEVFVLEDTPIGHSVIQIDAKGRDNRQVYYEIKSGDDYNMFSIGFTSGELCVIGRLNYSHTNSYKLIIKAIDSLTGSWSEGECAIEVLDINDNVPIFEKPFYDVLVPENAEIGTPIITVQAHDMDDGTNADIAYSLNSQSEETTKIFNINVMSGVIMLLAQLDAETKSTYILHITATDHGSPSKSSFTTVRVRVGDLNDNLPFFINGKYDFFVDANQLNDQFIGKVYAFDPDINDQLTYTLEKNSSYVRIDILSGAMYLVSSPKEILFIECVVIASDQKHEARVPVDVRIHTRSEERPLLKEKLKGIVREGQSKENDIILNVQSEQLQKEYHNEISYQIDSQFAKAYFSVSSSGDLLTTGKIFDRESISKFIIPIRATNHHGMFSLTDVTIKVLDDNDHVPLFEFPTYESYVVNSQMSAKSLIEVKAFDMDEGSNAELVYTTQGLSDISTPIHMNKTSGLISLAGLPKGLMYQFSARVSDNGYPVKQSSTNIQISVKRWTDDSIVFSNASYHVSVAEDVPINSLLVTVKASLKGYNGDLQYSLIHGNLIHTEGTHFQIDNQNGNIYLSEPLDYEKVKQHKLMVRVVSAISGDSGICFVFINVGNINDNTPLFDSTVYNVNIAEDVDIGESIIRVLAEDADDENGSMLTYEIVGGSSQLFSVDGNSGWVKVVKTLDRELQPSHKLKIVAKDNDGKYATTTLFINLIDINDCPPLFYTTNLTFFVKEDGLVKQRIAHVEASDADSTSIIQYFIKSVRPDNIFSIDIDSGHISLLRKLTRQFYEIVVIAYDGVHTSETVVSIKVVDVNNHTPLCLNSYYTVTINENTAQSRFLAQIRAEDDDPTDKLRYIIQGDGIRKFRVDIETGDLTVNSMLDYEENVQYHFKVVVADLADHMCTSDVFIKVADLNDNRPQFEQDVFFATVRENVSQSVVVTQVKAIDRDTHRNRQLQYKLDHDHNANYFAISPRGVITINKMLPRGSSRISSFSLIVTASDSGNPQMSSSVSLQILVLAVSDMPPQFSKLGYVFNVFENEPHGKVIGNIQVSASPNLKQEEVVMELINSAPGVFTLDSKNGNLSINALLDYERKHRYIFNVKAWFKLIPSLSSMVNVEVLVLDINDHRPKFLKKSYHKQIDENVRTGTFVLQTYAEDKDGTPENSQFSYKLISEKEIPFTIDHQTGIISVSQSIDYEHQSEYSFQVIAIDNGSPQLSSHVTVTVDITDLNDNAPIISRNHSNVIVQEGSAVGSNLLELFITDKDSNLNGAPFHCRIFNGDSRKFSIVSGKNNNCIVRSETKLYVGEKRKKCAYDLTIRVTDSGTPKQFSMSVVEIVIVKESHFPPVIQQPKLFFVIVSKPYVVTDIGTVKVFDEDEHDMHQFKINDGNDEGIFSIQEMRGVIEGKPSKGVYSLSVEVTDGKFSDSGVFKIIVNELDDKIKVKSVVLTFGGIDADIFIHSKIVQFTQKLAQVCGSSFEHVFIWSIQNMETKSEKEADGVRRWRRELPGIYVVLAVLKSDGENYIDPDELREYLINSRLDFEDIGLYLNVLDYDCSQEICPKAQKCVVTLVPTEKVSYNIPSGYLGFQPEEKCYCEDGNEGPVCYPSNSCLRNPCKFGEKCIQTESSYRCECSDGTNCNMAEVVQTFNGTSFAKYMLKEDFDDLFKSLSIGFRTESQSNEILFYAHGKDYFTLEIEEGFIQARFDFGSGPGHLSINSLVNDGNWHHIHIERWTNNMKISLDHGKFKAGGKAPGNTARININGHGIIFGARVSEEGSVSKGFKGCLKQPKLGKKLLPFRGSSDIVKSVESHNMLAGCKDSGMCTPNICPYFSDCKNTITSYVCKCLPGHNGPSCKSNLTCADRPCKNGGRCTYTQIKGVILYECSCKSGFTGAQCHISLGACTLPSPCQNGASCIPMGESSYECRCQSGYTGVRCEINDNPCASKKCYFGGRCVNLKEGYKCQCPAGRSGKECASGNYCKLIACQNGGHCEEKKDGGYCSCKEGFKGLNCNQDINECLLNPCPNERTCVNTFGTYYCNCTNGIKSKDCKMVLPTPKQEGFSMVIVIAGALAVIIIIIVVIIVIFCVRKRRYRYAHARTDDQADVPKYPLDRYSDYDNIEMRNMFPPSPPPRGVAAPPEYFDDQMSAAMYDPSAVTFSHPSLADDLDKSQSLKFTSRTSVDCNSDEEEYKLQPGYHWDYSEVPEDVINMKMSREGSRIGTHDQYKYYSDDQLQYVDLPHVPQLPQRPVSRRSSMHGYSDCDLMIPELPELPAQVRVSRQSLKNGNQSPGGERDVNDLESDYDHRYSLYDGNDDNRYIQDILGNETGSSDITTVTRPSRPYSNIFLDGQYNIDEGSEISEPDGYTETSLGSDDDDDDDVHRADPLDPENTRKLERDIKRLIKDLQKRTEEE